MTHRPRTGFAEDLDATQPLLQQTVASSTAVGKEASIPERLGRYTVLQLLGSGGFAHVLLAHDEELAREVAIKVPRRDRFKTAESLHFFLDEARTVARLRHPGIVSVFDVGSQDNTPFIVLEYIRGRTLAHLLEHDRLAFSAVGRMVAEIGDALAHAHELGFVHRDIKPLNILLDSDDRPHIADFGLAICHRDLVQDDDEAVGTRHYMAPEQVRAENHRIDGRTDLWGLGVVLYRLLVGRRPFDGSNAEELSRAILYSDPVPPREIDPTVPGELERICLRCLCRQMSDRYRTAHDLVEDLAEWLSFVGESSGSASTRRRSGSAIAPVPMVMPRGLRSFESEDADSYLRLVPGPRDRDGLPISIRFWKQQIESRNTDRACRVGILYGPSGCGKSSLMKAGLLPRLDSKVVPIYLESSAHGTEARLHSALQRQLERLPSETTLPEAVRLLREEPQFRDGCKVLIVLDQFEQWLDTWNSSSEAELVQALRHCDGAQVQSVLLVRDDFWLPVSRLMRQLEISAEEGVNAMLVDSFDLRHAQRVLHELGSAYDRLPRSAADLSAEQVAFIERATQQLAENDRLYPVRLAVFVEMIKNCDWVPQTLDEMGGTEGVGVAFVERSIGLQAPAPRRHHERAARNVLAALLPEAGQIKTRVRSRSELRHVAGYAERPQEFQELMHLLDVELRLLTPVRPADEVTNGAEAGSVQATEPVYQLTHDFLVPSIREWLQRQLRGTRQGRAQLLLEEQAAVWTSRPNPRYLPSLVEWIGLRLSTHRRDWTATQRRMMDAAAARIAHSTALSAAVLLLVAAVGFVVQRGVRQQQKELQASLLVTELHSAPPAGVPAVVADMEPYGTWVDPLLTAQADDATVAMRRRIRAAVALLPRDPSRIPWLLDCLLSDQTAPDDFLVVRQALQPYTGQVLERLHAALDNPSLASAVRFRAACAWAGFEPLSPHWNELKDEVAASLLREPAPDANVWIEALLPVRHHLHKPLLEVLSQTTSLEAARVGALALWTHDNQRADSLSAALVNAEGSRHRAIMELLRRNPDQSLPAVRRQLERFIADEQPADRLRHERGMASVIIALYELGDLEPLRRYVERRADPGVRSQIIHGLNPECLDFSTLWPLLATSEGASDLRNAALLAAWRHRNEPLRPEVREQLCERLEQIYEHDPTAEAHAAAGLVLRSLDAQRLAAIDGRLAGTDPAPARAWFVNGAGQKMVVLSPTALHVEGYTPPDDFRRPLAISATEATYEQVHGLVLQHLQASRPDARDDIPAVSMHLVHIAAYCNALSELDDIPPDQWCYPSGNDLAVTNCDPLPGFREKLGYRLPTSEEWELACRYGTVTSRFVGEDAELLQYYAWDRIQSRNQPHPVATLLPNPCGLFDVYGNVAELCIGSRDNFKTTYVRRGESCLVALDSMRSTSQDAHNPRALADYVGIRVVRTLPSENSRKE